MYTPKTHPKKTFDCREADFPKKHLRRKQTHCLFAYGEWEPHNHFFTCGKKGAAQNTGNNGGATSQTLTPAHDALGGNAAKNDAQAHRRLPKGYPLCTQGYMR